jgi:hypothetical protein
MRDQQKELSKLIQSSRGKGGRAVVFGVLFVIFAVLSIHLYLSFYGAAKKDRTPPSTLSSPALRSFLSRDHELSDWLERRGTRLEFTIYHALSSVLTPHAVSFAATDSKEVSFGVRVYLTLLTGVLQVVFVFLACWRIWCVAVLGTIAWRSMKFGAYKGDDMLGTCGNGRLFYSGARGSLDKVAKNGAPDIQVQGLVCLPVAADEQVAASPLVALLTHYGALNETTRMLVSHIIANPKIPSYVGRPGEEHLLAKRFEGVSLPENAGLLLENALFLHRRYLDGHCHDADFDDGVTLNAESDAPITKQENASLMLRSLHRVLTPKMRGDLAKLEPWEVATVVLSYEAGKVLGWAFEGGRWIRKSNFLELCARAALHGVAAYSREYSFESRMNVRRALIYGSRFSLLGPVRFPVDLSDEAFAARQWVELLMALPHELQSAADEVELCGVMREIHAKWSVRFFEMVLASSPEVTEGCFVGPSQGLYMPLHSLLSTLRQCVDHGTIRRLEELVSFVSQKQRLQAMSLDLSSEGSEPAQLPAYQRVLPPIPFAEMKRLSELHNVSIDDLRDWSALRVMLNSYSWLARRVGSRTVPESSVVMVAFKGNHDARFEANANGVVALTAMVPLRGSRLEMRFGKLWPSRYPEVLKVVLGQSQEDFDKLRKNVKDDTDDPQPAVTAIA